MFQGIPALAFCMHSELQRSGGPQLEGDAQSDQHRRSIWRPAAAAVELVAVLCVLVLAVTMASKAATSNGITLKGSVDIVTEFFGYSINRCVLPGAAHRRAFR